MKTSIFTIFAIATFCVPASAAGEWGPIQGTLGQSSGAPVQRVPAKTEAQLTEQQIEKAIQEYRFMNRKVKFLTFFLKI